MPHPTVSKSLNGLRMIDVEELGRMSAALGTSPDVVLASAVERLRAQGVKIVDLLPGSPSNVTPLRPRTNVSGPVEDDERAAASARTLEDETDEGYDG